MSANLESICLKWDAWFMEQGSNFLKDQYDLHTTSEVESASRRTNKHRELESENDEAFERVSQDPDARIGNYLSRFREIIERDDPERRQHGVDALKRLLYQKFVIRPNEVPQSYWDNQRKMAREMGHGDIEITDELRDQQTEVIISDQESTLSNWIDYLSSDDAIYPMWLKYFAMRGVLTMSTYDKQKHEFAARSKSTTAPYPDIDREALAYVLDVVEKHQSPEYAQLTQEIRTQKNQLKKLKGTLRAISRDNLQEGIDQTQEQINAQQDIIISLEEQQQNIVLGSQEVQPDNEEIIKFRSLLDGGDFAKLYAWALEKVTPTEESELLVTEGQWVKYERNSDHTPLVRSLQGHGTGWCTAGESTAQEQLKKGDFYVYYSNDKGGNPSIPRAAIRMEEDTIAEVRGIAAEQNLDPYIADVVREKVGQFPDGVFYEKKAYDMQMLTYIEHKNTSGQELNKDDLIFLYEMDSKIQGFGYDDDPRIQELRSQRDSETDMLTVFDCEPSQIAHNAKEIAEDTKIYIGALQPNIFRYLIKHNVEYIFTEFPEGRVQLTDLTIGGQTLEQLEVELNAKNVDISSPYIQRMLHSSDFTLQESPERLKLVCIRIGSLDLPDLSGLGSARLEKIYTRASELGLDLCPTETALYECLKDTPELMSKRYYIAMEQIITDDGYDGGYAGPGPKIFGLTSENNSLELNTFDADPEGRWNFSCNFMFRIRDTSSEVEAINS